MDSIVTGHESEEVERLSTETIQGSALSLQSVDNVERSDRLTLSMLSIGDGITNDTLEEGLENTSCLFVDH